MELDHTDLLQAVFESTAEGVLVVNESGKVIQSNERFQALWKIPADVLNTKDDEKLLNFILNQLHDPKSFIDKVKELYSAPDALSNDQIEFKDGRIFERFSRPLKLGGTSVGRLWNFRDVTEQKKSQQVFAAITELSPDIISIVGPEGKLTYNSSAAERIHGYKNEDLIGLNTLDLIHPDERDYVSRELAILLQKPGGFATVQYRYKNKNGSYSWMEATAYNQIDNPSIQGVVTISREIEKRKQLEVDLKDALSLRDDFMSIASHELKTPLTSIKLQLQMMLRSQASDHKKSDLSLRSESMNNLLDQVASLQRLIEDLLSVSKIRTGQLYLSLAEENLSKCVRKLVDQYQELFQEANCSLDVSIEDDIILNCDRVRIEQVFINLMANAIKYAPGTQINIQLRKLAGAVEFRIKDHGPGIPGEKQDLIFGRFERATSTSYTSGLGIGLFISKNIIEGHGGTIHVESVLHKGATFIVRLPLTLVE
jgi:two-component system sensor histidine kinase/response regulator